MSRRWKMLHQCRHYDEAYHILGLDFNDFVPARFGRQGDLAYPEDENWISTDEKFRVSAFVDEWGHSCRLIEYSVYDVSLGELAAIYERLASDLRVEQVAKALMNERHPGVLGHPFTELIEVHEIAEDLIRGGR